MRKAGRYAQEQAELALATARAELAGALQDNERISLELQARTRAAGDVAQALAEARAELGKLQAQQANISLTLFTMLADGESYRNKSQQAGYSST